MSLAGEIILLLLMAIIAISVASISGWLKIISGKLDNQEQAESMPQIMEWIN